MTDRKPIVAIDGPVGSGKTSSAKKAAKALDFTYVDTGAMYRAVTVEVLARGIDPADEKSVDGIVDEITIRLVSGDGAQKTLLNEVDVSERIRDRDVTAAVSAVSAMKSVRDRMTALQRSYGKDGGIVMEGRDIATVVFPDAEYKIYVDATVEVRAGRRYKELQAKGVAIELDTLIEEVKTRDRMNSERDIAPLKKAPDAIVLDTSGMSLTEQVQAIVDIVRGDS